MATRRRAEVGYARAAKRDARAGAALASGVSSSESSQTSSRRGEDARRRASSRTRTRSRGRNLVRGRDGGRTPRARCRPADGGYRGVVGEGSAPSTIFARDHGGRCPPRARRRGAALRRCIRPGTSTLADHPRRSVRTVNRIPTPDARPGLGDHGRAWAGDLSSPSRFATTGRTRLSARGAPRAAVRQRARGRARPPPPRPPGDARTRRRAARRRGYEREHANILHGTSRGCSAEAGRCWQTRVR